MAELLADFFGTDPLRGEDAAIALVDELGPAAIETLIPLASSLPGSLSIQVEFRLKAVALRLGPSIADYLGSVIANGHWHSKRAAASCYGAFDDSPEVEEPLVAILERGDDFDAERIAIEALTNLGADRWASDLAAYAKHDHWQPDFDLAHVPISKYAFEKVSSYVLEALARFVANARSRDRVDTLFRLLTDFLSQREELLPNRVPTSYDLVERHASRFTGWAIEPMIELWGRSGNAQLQRLCVDTLREVSSLRAAGFLLQMATNRHLDDSVRSGASIALGDLRDPVAAGLLADALRDEAVDHSFLNWAFSTLYVVPFDWPSMGSFVEECLDGPTEVGARLFYSLALRGERHIERRLVGRLRDGNSFVRWTSALALSRLVASDCLALLKDHADAAADPLERCGFLAGLVRAGDSSAAARLHDALGHLTLLPRLQDVWKLEILDAFNVAPRFDSRAFRVWSDVASVSPRKLQYFEKVVTRIPPEPISSRRAAPVERPKLFISYSHQDAAWLKRFVTMLHPLLDSSNLEIWEDTRIVAGQWRPQIDQAMRQSRVALFLVSSSFLASEFITRTELPELVRYATEEQQVQIIWALLDDCLWERSPLKAYQGDNIEQPLSLLSPGEQSRAIKKTCIRIEQVLAT